MSAEDEKKLVAWANEQFMRMKNARSKIERQWYLNLAFYFGQQNVVFKTVGRSQELYVPPAPYWRSRPIINLIRPRVRKEMSKLTSQKPTAYIVPASSDERDLYAANAGEQIWDSIYRFHKVHSVFRRSVFWTSITGNGFIKNYWSEEKIDELSQQVGDVCFQNITPFHLFVPDLREEELEEQPFLIHASYRNAEMLSQRFGKEIKFELSAKDELIEESFLSLMGAEKWKKDREILTLEVWIKPGKTAILPSGGMFTIAGNKVIFGPTPGWPYMHQRYPFAHIGNIETGKFYRDSPVVDMIPLQREYNRTRGQIIEAKNKMAKPQLAAEIGSVDPSKITNEPGQIIFYRPGFNAPQPIPLQPLPNYVLEEQDRIKQDIDDIAGQHEVSRGNVPSGVTAATAISYLQEQDESQLSYTFDSIEEAFEKVAYMTLNYVQQYWDTERKVKITGPDGTFDVKAFEGSELRGNTDVRVEGGSALPTSKAAKQAFILDLMKLGFIDPDKGLEVMEIGGINKVYEQIQVDIKQAQRENLKMAEATMELIEQHRMEEMEKFFQSPEGMGLAEAGMLMVSPDGTNILNMAPVALGEAEEPEPIKTPLIVPVNKWDDHRLHIERHNNYRKSQAFDNLPQEAKDLFDQHVNEHVTAIMVGAAGSLPPEMMQAGMFDINSAADQEVYKESVQQMNEIESESGGGGAGNQFSTPTQAP